jgi:nucleotide-binding universal stress UspA family protein
MRLAGDHDGMETMPTTTSHDRLRHVLLAADVDGSSAHAADEAIDLAAALASRKRTNLARMLGSVSSHVVDEAACPVVVVPA